MENQVNHSPSELGESIHTENESPYSSPLSPYQSENHDSPRELQDSLDSYLRDSNQNVQQSQLEAVNYDIPLPCSSGYSHNSEYNFPLHSTSFIRPETPCSHTSHLLSNPPPSSFNSIPDYLYPANTAQLSPTFEASTYLPLVPLPLPEESSPVSLDPQCAGCNAVCSNAHACPDCSRPVHVICGHPVDGMEGYGSPVYCNSCWLKRREMNILKNREISKRGQSKQIERMGKQSRKKVHTFVVGDNIVLSVPEVDKRSPFDPPNILGIVLHRSEEGFYRIGTKAGRINRLYIGTEFDLTHGHFLMPEDVPDIDVSFRSAVFRESLSNRKQFCNCTSGCRTNRCRCKSSSIKCNSRCHKNLACQNK